MNNKRLILAPDIGSQLKHVSPGDAFLHYSRVGFSLAKFSIAGMI